MSLRHPRYTAHLLDALMAVSPRVRLEGDKGEGISSSRWSFLAGLELLTAREHGGVEGATARLLNIREMLVKDDVDLCEAAVARIDAHLQSPTAGLYETEITGNQALVMAEAALTDSSRTLRADHLKALCDWEAEAISAQRQADDSAGTAVAAEVNASVLTEYLRAYLKDATVTVTGCAQLPGGLGKETHVFTATGDTFQGEFVMRRDMAVNLIPNTCHRVSTEFEVLKAVRPHGLPTPDVLWVDIRHDLLPGGDFIIMRRSRGLSGGTLFGATSPPDPLLNDQIGTLLGRLHNLPPLTELGELTESIRPEFWVMPASEAVRTNLRGYLSMLLACPHAPSLATVAVLNWLIANVPESQVMACLNHGDVGFHNMLIDQGELTALLDWENAHIGHPAEDLAYLYNAAAADLNWPRVMDAYRAAGGIAPPPSDLLYFRIMMLARIAISLNIAPSRLLNGEVRDLRLLVAESFMRPRVLQSIGALIDEYAHPGILLANPDMSEPLADELSVYLRCARDELLLDTTLEQDPFKPHRARRVAAALTHLIARSEVLTDVEAALEPKVAALLSEALVRAEASGAGESSVPADAVAGAAWARLARIVDHLSKMAPQSPAAAGACHWLICRIRELEELRLSLMQTAMNDLAAADARRLASRSSELAPLSAEDAAQFLRASFPSHPGIALRNFSQSKGVNSKENYQFEITGLEEAPVPAILRRDRNFEIVPTSASREFELLNELRARGLPVAQCLAVQYDDAPPLCRPSLLMVRAAGSPLRKVDAKTLARIDPKLVTPDLILQLAEPLARLHSTKTDGLPLPGLMGAGSNRARFLTLLEDYHQRLHRFQREPFPIFEAAFAYLRANAHLIDDRVTLVHADFDLRNVLFDDRRLSVILDFELAHLGHPAEDLGYLRNDIEPLMPWSDFLAAYRAAGGEWVADELVRYFQIWAWAFRGSCNVTAFSGYRSGVHGDVFLGTLSFVETLHVQHRLIQMLPSA